MKKNNFKMYENAMVFKNTSEKISKGALIISFGAAVFAVGAAIVADLSKKPGARRENNYSNFNKKRR